MEAPEEDVQELHWSLFHPGMVPGRRRDVVRPLAYCVYQPVVVKEDLPRWSKAPLPLLQVLWLRQHAVLDYDHVVLRQVAELPMCVHCSVRAHQDSPPKFVLASRSLVKYIRHDGASSEPDGNAALVSCAERDDFLPQ